MSIEPLREGINQIDREIIRLIAKRQALAEKIARIKTGQGLPVHDEARVQEVLQSSFNYAVEHKINPVYVQKIMQLPYRDERGTAERMFGRRKPPLNITVLPGEKEGGGPINGNMPTTGQ